MNKQHVSLARNALQSVTLRRTKKEAAHKYTHAWALIVFDIIVTTYMTTGHRTTSSRRPAAAVSEFYA